VTTAVLAAFAAGALGLLAAAHGALALLPVLRERAPRAARAAGAAFEAVVRAGSEGRDPGAVERRRLLAAGAVAACALGWTVAGPAAAVGVGAAGPWLVARLLRARRERYRAAIEAGAGAMAVAVADALGGGHSLRGALAEAAAGLPGPAGHELRRTSAELAAGARTEAALEALRERARSDRVDTIVAACLLQRRAGGDLAALLRESAAAFEDDARLRDEVRAATAQARFTGLVVVMLPLGGALLAELAAPGFLVELWRSPLTAWLVGMAIALQVAAAVLIRRLGRPQW
jgi:tight adherence protein B